MIKRGIANAIFGMAAASAQAGIETEVLFIEGGFTPKSENNKYHNNQITTSQMIGKDKMASTDKVRVFFIHWDNAIDKSLRLVKILKPDILHLHTFLLFPIAYAIKKEIGTSMVYTAHSLERAHMNKNPLDYLFQSQTQEALMSLVDITIAISKTNKELFLHYCPELSDRIKIVGNGTGYHVLLQPKSKYSKDRHLVLYVGRFHANKGVEDLLEAIPYVIEQDRQVHFIFLGAPLNVSKEEMERQWLLPSNSFPYRKQITFIGRASIAELRDWYNKASILVVPSSYDTFPLVILEGMQHGLVVVASAIGGALDIIKHGQTGLLFTPKDVKDLINCILLLLKNPSLCHQIGSAAANEIQNNWLWSHVAGKLQIIYREAM
jgi:glycosyltransferase involved in cell wall biosynthesis